MVVGRQSNVPASFTPEEIPGTHFQRLSRPQGTWHTYFSFLFLYELLQSTACNESDVSQNVFYFN